MTIFTSTQIEKSLVYAPLMIEINELYLSLNSPKELLEGSQKTTTGSPFDASKLWDASAIGDWDGLEEQVADKIRAECLVVANTIDLGTHYYYATAEWVDFCEQAQSLFRDFNASQAFDRLCDRADHYLPEAGQLKTTYKKVDDALHLVIDNCVSNSAKFSDWGLPWGGNAAAHINDTYSLALNASELRELNKALAIIVEHETKTSTAQAIEVARSLM